MRIETIHHAAIPAWTETKEIYSFEELAPGVQGGVIDREYNAVDIDVICEGWSESVKAIADLIGARYEYEIGPCSYNHLKFKSYDEPEDEIEGIRALVWIQNNWIDRAYKGKYFSTPFKKCKKSPEHPAGLTYKKRYSAIMLELDNCPFTGICYDCNFSETWKRFKQGIRDGKKLTVSDFIKGLEQNLLNDICSEVDYRYSREGIIEEINDRGLEFYADGEEVI